MTSRRVTLRARVRHEADRSYTVIVEGPDGEAEVGNTTLTAEVIDVAVAGAARLFDVPRESVRYGRLKVPRPPYGIDGQHVRIRRDGDEQLNGRLGIAHWFGGEGCWHVDVVDNQAGFIAGEYLDFDPVIGDLERVELESYRIASLEVVRQFAAAREFRRGRGTP